MQWMKQEALGGGIVSWVSEMRATEILAASSCAASKNSKCSPMPGMSTASACSIRDTPYSFKSMCVTKEETVYVDGMAIGEARSRADQEKIGSSASSPAASPPTALFSPPHCHEVVIHRKREFFQHSYLIAELINIGSVCFHSGQYQLGARCFGDALRAARRAHRLLPQTDAAIVSNVSLSETILAVDSAHEALSTFTITSCSVTKHADHLRMPTNNATAFSIFANPMSFEQESDSESIMPRMLAVILFNLGLCHHVCGIQTDNSRCYIKARESYKLALKQLREECTMKPSSFIMTASFVMRHMAILNNLGCVLQSVERNEKGSPTRQRYVSCFQTIGRLLSFFDNDDGNGVSSQERAVFEINILIAGKGPSPAA